MNGSPYETQYDADGRRRFAAEVENFAKGRKTFTFLIIGTPDCKELIDLSEENRKKIDLLVFDFEINHKAISDDFKESFNSCEVYAGNFFTNIHLTLPALFKPDLVFHRWFLHHCTTEQKKISFEIIEKLLSDDGVLLMIDWFIPDYSDWDEKWSSTLEYYTYQKELDLAPSERLWRKNFDAAEVPNGRGGKFTSTKKIELLLQETGFTYKKHVLCKDLVENPELFGQNMYICRKGQND